MVASHDPAFAFVARAVMAFAIAPGVVPFTLYAIDVCRGGLWPQGSLVFALYAYVVALAFGVPTFLCYHFMGWRRAWQYLIGGAVIGAIPMVIAMAPDWPRAIRRFPFEPFLGFAAIGAVSALVFWVVALARWPKHGEP